MRCSSLLSLLPCSSLSVGELRRRPRELIRLRSARDGHPCHGGEHHRLVCRGNASGERGVARRLLGFGARLGDEQLTAPIDGSWSAKDLLAHIAAWEQVTIHFHVGGRPFEQVTGLVRWRESVQYMRSNGVDTLVECGSGKVLSGLAKRIDKEMTGLALNAPPDIEAFLKTA